MHPPVAIRDVLLAALMVCTSSHAQSFDPSELRLLRAMERTPNTLARYQYLIREVPALSSDSRVLGMQFLSFSQNELGLYDQAAFSFPLQDSLPAGLVLPSSADWKSFDAVDAIAALAAQRHIVMINEAHHEAHTRLLTLMLLPRLRALGFHYFAAEALSKDDPALARRGYPLHKSGTEYLLDPLYGDIVREAIRLGFVIVPYDNALTGQPRENAQAETLYRQVFARDPHARLFVHAGYAHIDKIPGRLGELHPMAMQLEKLIGQVPLSIDQTNFIETGTDTSYAYRQLIRAFPSNQPEVLINRRSGQPWTARPSAYDVNVILPSVLNIEAFGEYKFGYSNNAVQAGLPHISDHDAMQRSSWLTLGGARRPYPISAALCRGTIPCVVEALYAGEPDDAIAADRYAFMGFNESTELYLRPGHYRLRAWDSDGGVRSERDIAIAP